MEASTNAETNLRAGLIDGRIDRSTQVACAVSASSSKRYERIDPRVAGRVNAFARVGSRTRPQTSKDAQMRDKNGVNRIFTIDIILRGFCRRSKVTKG